MDAAERKLSSLDKLPFRDPSLEFEIQMLRTRYQILRRNYTKAFTLVDGLLAQQKVREGDIDQHARLLTAKAKIFAEAGRPEKGFSYAIRAVDMAARARILPAVWEAVGALGIVLNAISEFQAAADLVDAVIPQV